MGDRTFALKNFPLCWPEDWKRTPRHQHKRAKFTTGDYNLSVNGGINRVLQELTRHGIKRDDILISTNLETRLDGLPRSDARWRIRLEGFNSRLGLL